MRYTYLRSQAYYEKPDYWMVRRQLEDAIDLEKSVFLQYDGGSTPGEYRPVIPDNLEGNLLEGFCGRAGEERKYFVSKVLDLVDVTILEDVEQRTIF
jgi:hypothetical protein